MTGGKGKNWKKGVIIIIIIIIITDIYMARIRKMQQKRQVNCYRC